MHRSGETAMGMTTGVLAGLALGASLSLLHTSHAQAQGAATSPVRVTPPAAVVSKANAPQPPATAAKKTNIGKGKAATNTSNASGDGDSFWVEEIDIDGDGNVEEADLLWDDEDKILFLGSSGDFTCQNGGVGTGDLLIAVYGTGNSLKKPAGSGFYVVDLDEGECRAQADATRVRDNPAPHR